jgi:hypothetical protein
MTYQLTILGFIIVLAFHLLGLCLGYSIVEGMVKSLFTFLNFSGRDLSNYLSSNKNRDGIHKLCAKEVDVPTYNFGVNKTISI